MAERLIDIRKIVRNTTKSNLVNGDMDEIINLRHEDGKWKPLPKNVKIWSQIDSMLNVVGTDGTKSSYYSQIFIHTGKNYKHVLGIRKSDKAIVYIGDANTDDTLTKFTNEIYTGVSVAEDKVQVYQIGNLLVLNDMEQVQYILFRDGEYKRKTINPNELNTDGYLEPDGLSQLRVVPTCDEHGVPKILVANGDISDNDDVSWDSIKEEASATGLSMIAQARKIAKEKGLLNGFVVGVVAYQLYDGSYTFASRPILLSQPNDEGTRYDKVYGLEDVAKVVTEYSLDDDIKKHINYTAVDKDDLQPISSNGKNHSFRYNPKAMNIAWQKNEKWAANEYKTNKRAYFWNDSISAAATLVKSSSVNDNINNTILRNNCEIYWGGGEQGHNVGEIYKDGVVSVGGSDNGVSSYGEMPLYEKDYSKSSSGCDVPIGFDMFSMAIRSSKNYNDCFRQLDTTVSIRGSFAQEITIPYEDRMKSGNRQFEVHRGCDDFNPPNAFSVVHCEQANGDDTCHNWFSSARKVKGVQQAYGFLMTNGLQVKIGSYNPDYSDIITDVCVFISSEIYYADENDGTSVKVPLTDVCRTGSGKNSRAIKQTGVTVYANPKEDKKLVQDIKDVPVLYKVWSKPYKSINAGEWIDIELKDKLNILEECETLNVDASYCRNSIKAKCSYLYNGRLHLANIEESYFDGYPLSYFEMPDQWEKSIATNYSRSLATAYDFRDTGGKDNNKSAFKLISTDTADLYVGYKCSFSQSTDGEDIITINSSPYTYTVDGETFGYVRYIDSETGAYYTKSSTKERIDISTDKYYLSTQNGLVESTFNIINVNDTTIAFQKVSDKSTITFQYDVNETVNATDRLYTHHGDENVGFWEGNGDIIASVAITVGSIAAAVVSGGMLTGVAVGAILASWTAVGVNREIRTSVISEASRVFGASNQKAADRFFFIRMMNMMWWKYDVCKQWDSKEVTQSEKDVFIAVELDTADGKRVVGRVEKRSKLRPLNPMLSYPDSRAKKMIIGWVDSDNNKVHQKVFDLEKFNAMACAVYVSEDVKPIKWWDGCDEVELDGHDYISVDEDGVVDIKRVSTIEDRRNVLKVSATESPLYFPAANTYQVGNGEIRAIMANTMALSVGQYGDAPLYCFCSDGIYGMFVDSTGQMCYPNSRPISREVCNNALGVLPIDDAVVYPSSRGLFLISGASNNEISAPAEGKPLDFANSTTRDYLNSMKLIINRTANTKWLNIPYSPTDEDFKEYIKNSVCGWNYQHSELWVSNPTKAYTYIFSEGGWSKVMRKIEYYINDYPRTYAIEVSDDGTRSVIDIENNTDTPTDCFFITRPIVIDGETAKTFTRAWAYGDFFVHNDANAEENGKHKASILVYGSHDGAKFGLIGVGGVTGNSRDILAKLHRMSMRYVRIAFAGKLKKDSIIECLGLEVKGSWGIDSTKKVR